MAISDFDNLQPQLILDSIEAAGYRTTGEYSQLNSYENRVFDIRLEKKTVDELHERAVRNDDDDAPGARNLSDGTDRVIAKFYRPRRWSPQAIQDEHDFLTELAKEGIPAVAALPLSNGKTLQTMEGYTMALFPRVLGRNPQEFLGDELKQVGRTMARIHNVGARHPAKHRPQMDAATYGWPALERLERFVYPELWRRYRDTAEQILHVVEDDLDPKTFFRIHGDCHKGNLVHSGKEFYFVDFDDFCNGPAAQDFWMLLGANIDQLEAQKDNDLICDGYEELRKLPNEWHLFEPLRGLRIIHYAGWVANRWNDPFFKRVFPDFEGYNYWAQELHQLEEILSQLK